MDLPAVLESLKGLDPLLALLALAIIALMRIAERAIDRLSSSRKRDEDP